MKMKLVLFVTLFASIVSAIGQGDIESQQVDEAVEVAEPRQTVLQFIRNKCTQMSDCCRKAVCKKPVCYRLVCICPGFFKWDGMMGSRDEKCCSVKCVRCCIKR